MTYVTMTKFESDLIKSGKGKEAFESMLARFNKLVQGSGIFRELKESSTYEKPCDKRRRKHIEAVARINSMNNKEKRAVHKKRAKR